MESQVVSASLGQQENFRFVRLPYLVLMKKVELFHAAHAAAIRAHVSVVHQASNKPEILALSTPTPQNRSIFGPSSTMHYPQGSTSQNKKDLAQFKKM